MSCFQSPSLCVLLVKYSYPYKATKNLTVPCVGDWKRIICELNDCVRFNATRPQCFLDVCIFCERNLKQSGNKLLLCIRTKEKMREDVAAVSVKAH